MRTKMVVLLIAILLTASSIQAGNFKKYPHKSGKIVYKLSGDTKGTRTLYWDDYGLKELTEEHSETKMFGMTNKTDSYVLNIGATIYSWIDETEEVSKSTNPFVEAWIEEDMNSKEVEKSSKEIMEGLGFTKIGSEIYQGKNCEIWEGMGSKVWAWQTYALKTEVEMMGVNVDVIADVKDFGASIPASKFEYPKDRKLIDTEAQMQQYYDENEGEEEYEEEISPEDAKEMMKQLFKKK